MSEASIFIGMNSDPFTVTLETPAGTLVRVRQSSRFHRSRGKTGRILSRWGVGKMEFLVAMEGTKNVYQPHDLELVGPLSA